MKTYRDRLTAWLEGAGAVLDLGGASRCYNQRFTYVHGSLRDDAQKLRTDGGRVQTDFVRGVARAVNGASDSILER